MKVTDHISIYLELAETAGSLPTGWEVNAIINFFIYNQIEDKYFGLQGTWAQLNLSRLKKK